MPNTELTDSVGDNTPHDDWSTEPSTPSAPASDDPLTRRSQWSNWTVMAMLVLCFFVIYYVSPRLGSIFRGDDTGKELSQLDLQPLIGDQPSVALSDLTGRVVLLNFWGTWCPPCRVEFPHLAALREKFLDQTAFRLLSVSCGPGGPEDLDSLRQQTNLFLQQTGIRMPIYADPDFASRKAVDELIGFEGYPTTLIIGRRGNIRGTWVNFTPGDEVEMETLVAELLAEG
ncbi:MAG: TlpA disulfide reductase family protein [Thermoguttaceae bacterium]